MALKLDDRPAHQYDDDRGWYNPGGGTDDGLEEAFNAPSATNDNLPKGHPSRKKSLSDSDLAESEHSVGSSAESDSSVDEEKDSLYTEEDDNNQQRRGFRISRNQGIGSGIVALLIGGAIGGFSIGQGPLKLMHFSNLLQRFHFSQNENFADTRLGKIMRHARHYNTPENRQLPWYGNKIADHYEARMRTAGMEPVYEGGRSGRFNAIDIDANTTAGKRALGEMLANGVDVPPQNADGKVRIDLSDSSARQRRMALKGMVGGMNKGRISSAVAKRTLKIRGQVDFAPLKNISRAADEKLADFVKKRMEQRNQGHQAGAPDASLRVEGENPVDADGNPTSTAGTDAAAELESDKPASPEAPDVKSSSANVRAKIGAGVGATAVLGLFCGLYELGEEIPEIKHTKLVLPLLRTGFEVVSTGSQIALGPSVSWDEIRAFAQQLDGINFSELLEGSDARETGSAFSAASVQAEQGKEITGLDMPSEAVPTTDKPALFNILDSIIEGIPGGPTTCSAVTSTAGGWALSIVGAAIGAAGPVGFATSLVTDIAVDIGLGKAIEGALRWYIGEPLDPFPRGALLGNYANYGTRLAANDSFISQGGTELSGSESLALAAERKELEAHRLKQQSLFARYFDIREPTSLAARTLFETDSIQTSMTNIASLANPLKILGSVPITPKIHAATPYDYGFPLFGFTVNEMDSDTLDDPFAIAERVEPNLEALNSEYGEACFGVTVDPSTFKLDYGDDTKRYDEIEDKCKNRNDSELTDYRMYLADLSVAKSMACYEGIDGDACTELGFGAGQMGGSDPGGGTAPPADVDLGTLYEPSENVACADGTRDLGVHDGYKAGTLIRIRLCAIDEIPSQTTAENSVPGQDGKLAVNSRMSAVYLRLAKDAQSEGIDLAASEGYRTMARQEYFWNCYQTGSCNNGNEAAQPGHSNHQAAVAVDWRPSVYNWLEGGKAATYGLQKCTCNERWHYSPDGG